MSSISDKEAKFQRMQGTPRSRKRLSPDPPTTQPLGPHPQPVHAPLPPCRNGTGQHTLMLAGSLGPTRDCLPGKGPSTGLRGAGSLAPPSKSLHGACRGVYALVDDIFSRGWNTRGPLCVQTLLRAT